MDTNLLGKRGIDYLLFAQFKTSDGQRVDNRDELKHGQSTDPKELDMLCRVPQIFVCHLSEGSG